MRTFLNQALLGITLLFISSSTFAANWVLDPGLSTVVFKYNYGSDEYEGTFTNVEAQFDIDPLSPGSCDFDVTINIENIDVDSPEVLDYLLDYEPLDWRNLLRIRWNSHYPGSNSTNDFSFRLEYRNL